MILSMLALASIPSSYAAGRPRLPGPSVPPELRTSLTHSHNDYERTNPLRDALEARMDSVEVDVWWEQGHLLVSHSGQEIRGTLREIYLEPMDRIVKEKGSVGVQEAMKKPFLLWIELKQGHRELLSSLHKELSRWSWITRFEAKQVIPGPVLVILTGDASSKMRYLREFSIRYADTYTHELPGHSPHEWDGGWYALNYGSHFRWDGWGAMPESEQLELRKWVGHVHQEGRKLRIYGAPDEETFWDLALRLGVDLIGTDRPRDFREFLDRPVTPAL